MFFHIWVIHICKKKKNNPWVKQNRISGLFYLDNEGTEDDTAEDEVVKDALENVPFSMNLPRVDLIEKLHHHKGVEHDGVVFGRSGVEGRVSAAVDVKYVLSYRGYKEGLC